MKHHKCDVAWCRNYGLIPVSYYSHWSDLENKPIKVNSFCIKHNLLWRKQWEEFEIKCPNCGLVTDKWERIKQ